MSASQQGMLEARAGRFQNLADGGSLDVLIIGGGIGGASLYQTLCRRGYRVALVDKGDFSSGTSQASGMLIWGGLLYLKNLEFSTVAKLCTARKRLLRMEPGDAAPLDLHYLLRGHSRARSAFVWLVLQFYWLLGGCNLRRPHTMRSGTGGAHVYQEAMLRASDCRFVIKNIVGNDSTHHIPLNHCQVAAAAHDEGTGVWRIDLRDSITGAEHHVRAKTLVNAAGVWTDDVNRIAGLESPYKHVWSKGVYLTFPRDGENEARVHPMRGHNDVLTHVPWGPVMMWGPTETPVRDLESSLLPDRGDIRFLLDEARRCLPGRCAAEDVVSVRCGIRPLAVPRNFNRDVYPLELSRRHHVVTHKHSRALTLYGGKLTSSHEIAKQAAAILAHWITPAHKPLAAGDSSAAYRAHPRLGCEFVTPEWARDHEFCVTLEDYLRRRTSIAQWTPRMGLGRDDAHRQELLEIAGAFSPSPHQAAERVDGYEDRVRAIYDPLFSA